MTRLPSEGETFGRCLLRRVLGAGGMGMVFAAHDPVLDREVALKPVVPHLAGDPEFRARFQHEAEVLARLDSARIVQIFDHGEHDGMNHSYNPGTWVTKETYFGRKVVGRHGSNGGRYRLVRIYTASGTRPWTYVINASSRERRARLYDSTKGFRWPGSFRGFAL